MIYLSGEINKAIAVCGQISTTSSIAGDIAKSITLSGSIRWTRTLAGNIAYSLSVAALEISYLMGRFLLDDDSAYLVDDDTIRMTEI